MKKETQKALLPAIPIKVAPVPRYGTRAWLRYFLNQSNNCIIATPVAFDADRFGYMVEIGPDANVQDHVGKEMTAIVFENVVGQKSVTQENFNESMLYGTSKLMSYELYCDIAEAIATLFITDQSNQVPVKFVPVF